MLYSQVFDISRHVFDPWMQNNYLLKNAKKINSFLNYKHINICINIYITYCGLKWQFVTHQLIIPNPIFRRTRCFGTLCNTSRLSCYLWKLFLYLLCVCVCFKLMITVSRRSYQYVCVDNVDRRRKNGVLESIPSTKVGTS